MIKENDIVIIRDFSFSGCITEEGLIEGHRNSMSGRQKFRVLRTGKNDVQVFTYLLETVGRRIADTILIGLEDGVVWFALADCLELTTHTITIDGKDIEISHESFENLKEQLK